MAKRRILQVRVPDIATRYVITTHGHLAGARLSKCGHWGNVPYASAEEANAAAILDAKGEPFTVERRSFPALSTAFAREPSTR